MNAIGATSTSGQLDAESARSGPAPSSRRPCDLVEDRVAGARSPLAVRRQCPSAFEEVPFRGRRSPSGSGEAPAALRCAAASIAALPLSRGERVGTAPKARSSRRRDAYILLGSLNRSLRSRVFFPPSGGLSIGILASVAGARPVDISRTIDNASIASRRVASPATETDTYHNSFSSHGVRV